MYKIIVVLLGIVCFLLVMVKVRGVEIDVMDVSDVKMFFFNYDDWVFVVDFI